MGGESFETIGGGGSVWVIAWAIRRWNAPCGGLGFPTWCLTTMYSV